MSRPLVPQPELPAVLQRRWVHLLALFRAATARSWPHVDRRGARRRLLQLAVGTPVLRPRGVAHRGCDRRPSRRMLRERKRARCARRRLSTSQPPRGRGSGDGLEPAGCFTRRGRLDRRRTGTASAPRPLVMGRRGAAAFPSARLGAALRPLFWPIVLDEARRGSVGGERRGRRPVGLSRPWHATRRLDLGSGLRVHRRPARVPVELLR
jgi:hypothetical protein